MVNCPDSCLNPITMPGHRKPCPTLPRKMDTAAKEKLATTTLRKVDAMQFWTGDKMTPKIEDAWAPRKLSAVTRMPCADYAMTMMIRAATGSPITETKEPEESYKEDEEVGSTKLLPSRAAAAKLSRRAAATKLSAKRMKLSPSRQAARELGLGSDGCHDDCSPQTYCSPEMRAATKNHERFAYTPPLPQMERELRYERCQDGGDTQMYDNYEMYESYGYARFASTQSPLPPPVEDPMQDYKVLGAFSNLTALQPGPWNISSSVQCGQAALCTADSSSSVAGPVSCCLLLCSVESCRTTLSRLQASHHQAPAAHCVTWPGVPGVWTQDGPSEDCVVREAREQRPEEGPRGLRPDAGAVQQV